MAGAKIDCKSGGCTVVMSTQLAIPRLRLLHRITHFGYAGTVWRLGLEQTYRPIREPDTRHSRQRIG